MRILYIFLAIVTLIVLYLLFDYLTKSPSLTSLHNAKSRITIGPESLPNSTNSNNFTYSIWFYVSDWNYKYNEEKIIFSRMNDSREVSTQVALGALENNVDVRMTLYPGAKTGDVSGATSEGHSQVCSIPNVPLQKWVNLLISVYGRSMDMYLDGKLVKTCVLRGLPKIDSTEPVVVTPNGGFAGYTANFQYFDRPSNPQQAWSIYRAGYGGGSYIGNIFSKYKVKVSFLENDRPSGSFEI
jgi:hypothetical protein